MAEPLSPRDPVQGFEADGTPSPGAQIALNGKSNVGHTHAWGEVTGKPTTFPPTTHTHTQAQVDGLDAKLAVLTAATADTGWLPITLREGFPAQSGFAPEIRRIGSVVFLRGGVNGAALSATNTSYIVGDIPSSGGLRPSRDLYLMGSSSQANFAPLVVLGAGGTITIRTAAVLGGYYLLDPISYPN